MADLTRDVAATVTSRLTDLRAHKKLDAVVEASRIAALAAVPRLRSEHEALVARRGPARPVRGKKWTPREFVAVAAVLLALLAAGLVLPSPRNGRPALGVDTAALWVGLCAASAIVMLAVLQRGRRDSYLLGAHTRTTWKLCLAFAIVWTLVLVYMLGNWDDVDRFEPVAPALGAILLGAAILTALVLTFVSYRADKAALADPEVAAKNEWGESATDADPEHEWWVALPLKLSPDERRVADRSYGIAIDVLERENVIRPADARRLRRKKPPVVWGGDAG